VLLQGYPNLEYIVMDGGSTDGSVEIIEKYEPWLAYWSSQKDGGQVNAINKGFERATGDIHAYLNSDDRYEPEILRDVAEHFSCAIDVQHCWVASEVINFSAGEEILVRPPPDLRAPRWVTRQAAIHQPGTFWSAALFKEVGGFDEAYQSAFDRKFFMELIFRGYRPEVVERVGARFRLHDASKTGQELLSNGGGVVFIDEMVRISEEFIDLLPPCERRAVAAYLRQQALSRLRREVGTLRGPGAAAWFLLHALRRFPSSVATRFLWGTAHDLLRG
jgi:glycosyltransferase involved in cell wall biosynthesis